MVIEPAAASAGLALPGAAPSSAGLGVVEELLHATLKATARATRRSETRPFECRTMSRSAAKDVPSIRKPCCVSMAPAPRGLQAETVHQPGAGMAQLGSAT